MRWRLFGQIKGLFLTIVNHTEARLYDSDIGPMKVAGLDKYGRCKIMILALNSSAEDLKKVYNLPKKKKVYNELIDPKF